MEKFLFVVRKFGSSLVDIVDAEVSVNRDLTSLRNCADLIVNLQTGEVIKNRYGKTSCCTEYRCTEAPATNQKATDVEYGIFYKSHGKFIGPYMNEIFNNLNIAMEQAEIYRGFLKAKVEVRKMNEDGQDTSFETYAKNKIIEEDNWLASRSTRLSATKRKTNKVQYGIFYKSHGEFIGPYCGLKYNNKHDAMDDVPNCRILLKSKVEVRPV